MEYQISCSCGKELVVSPSMAGLTVDCTCGQAVEVPSLSQMKPVIKERVIKERVIKERVIKEPVIKEPVIKEPVIKEPAAAKPRRPLTRRKKLAFTALTLLLLAVPIWFGLEIIYRITFSIPLVGGVVGKDDERLSDAPGNLALISRFRRSENPILFYEPRPGATQDIYTINSAGFRDYEYSVEKDPGVFRIAVLGDSIVWGHGLELQDTFANKLESMLNVGSEQRFEVLNFGVSGYSTRQEVELFRVKAKQYDPDLVIVGYCINDFKESSVEGDIFKHLYYDIFSKSYLYDHLERVIAGVSYNQFGYMADAPAAQFDLREQFRLLESYRDGRRSLVVVFPMLVDFNNYLFAVDHRRVHDALDGLNYETLDLLHVFRESDPASLVFHNQDRTHPNRQGARLAARATLELIDEKQLAPVAEVDTAVYADYEGTYEVQPGFVLTVTREGEQLELQAPGQPKLKFYAESDVRFFAKATDAQLSFLRNQEGRVDSMDVYQAGQHRTANRIESPVP